MNASLYKAFQTAINAETDPTFVALRAANADNLLGQACL